MTECWINSSSTIKQIDGYHSFNTEKYINKSGGVIVYVKQKWSPNVLEPDLKEANCLIVDVPSVFTVLGIYRSPSFRDTTTFVSELDRNLKLLKPTPCLMIAGDLNINILDAESGDENTSSCLNLLFEHRLIPAINVPTHFKSCIDHIFVPANTAAESVVCQTDLTDHSIVMVGIACKIKKALQRHKYIIDYAGLKSDVEKIDWQIIIRKNSLEEDASNFSNAISESIQKNCQMVRISHSKFNIKPWMTPGLIRCSKHRDKLHKECRNFPEDENKKFIYTRYRNFYVSLLRKLKSEFESKELRESKNCPKKLWNTINKLSHRRPKNSKSGAQELLASKNDPQQSNPLDRCNSFFSSVGKNLASSILTRLNESQESLAAKIKNTFTPLQSLFLSPTDEQEVSDLIQNLDLRSSPGIDNISNKVLKAISKSIIKPLTCLFNHSIESGTFPKVWKTAVVIPIHKEAAKDDPSNYRPISLLSNLSKLLERIIHKRLVSYLESNGLITNSQFGFRRGKSTEDAVTLLTNIVSTHLDSGHCCIGVFLDLAKAFDTVSVPILLKKLESYGIRGTALDWFTSYLTERKQCVRIDNHVSKMSSINFGVPQGSILGPTLFILYINDITTIPLQNADVICYADDTAVIFKDSTWDLVQRKAENGMRMISEWLTLNILTLNTAKTKFLCFHKTLASGPTHRLNQLQIHTCHGHPTATCNCDSISKVCSLKYLGVTIDEKLNFKEHIAVMSGRVRKMIHVMRNLRDASDGKTLKMVYLALCQSILNYCILAWGGAAQSSLISLERAQRGVLKVALFKPVLYPTAALFEEAQVLSVRRLFILRAVIHTHKTVIASSNYNELLKKRVFKIPTPITKTSFSHRFSRFLLPYTYNKMVNICHFQNSSVHEAKTLATKLLLQWSYDQAENILKSI